MAAILAAFHFADSIVVLAPEVGLEPTTLRLTATELVNFPLATDCYKSLFVMNLADLQVSRIATRNPRFSTDFERAWVQKWVQRLCPLTITLYRHI